MKLIPFFLFVLVMTATPGPGNLTMMTIGEAAGFRGASSFLLGTITGFFTLNLSVALGLGSVIRALPIVDLVLKGAGLIYIIYLVIKILKLNVKGGGDSGRFTFIEGFLIHPFSPKSWGMSLVGFSQFAEGKGDPLFIAFQFAIIFFIFQFLFHSLWCLAGSAFSRWMEGAAAQMVIRIALVMLMAGAGVYAVIS